MRPLMAAAGVAAMLLAGTAQTSVPMRLGAADYVAIETAYSRALHDRGAKDGVRYWLTNLAIEPSQDGAVGWAYIVEGRGLEFANAALHQDQWTTTGGAWRMSRRAVHAGNAMPPREHVVPPSNAGRRAFTPR